MLFDVEFAVIVLSLLLQLSAAFFSYSIYLRHRNYMPWLAITIALILMTFRRMFSLFISIDAFSEFGMEISFLDRVVVPLISSSVFFYAFWSIKQEFDSAAAAADKSAGKIKRLSRI